MNMEIVQEQARLSGLVFLDQNKKNASPVPEWTTKEYTHAFLAMFLERRNDYAYVVVSHPGDTQNQTVVVFLGGHEGIISNGNDSAQTSSVVLWNVENEERREGPEMIQQRRALAAVVCGNNIYTIGGSPFTNPNSALDSIERISISELLLSNTMTSWKALGCRLSQSRKSAHAVTVQNRYIVVVGGYTNATTGQIPVSVLSPVDILDTEHPNQLTLIAGPCLSPPRQISGIAAIGSRVFVIAEKPKHGSFLYSVEYFDVHPSRADQTNRMGPIIESPPPMSWRLHTDMFWLSDDMDPPEMVRVGSCLVVVGGSDNLFATVLDTKRNKTWELPVPMETCFKSLFLSDGIACWSLSSYTAWTAFCREDHIGLMDKHTVLFQRLKGLSARDIASFSRIA